jgi:hypothetical protein
MLRQAIPILLVIVAIGPAVAADGPVVTKRAAYRAAKQLPPGLPRPHYKARTTVVYGPPVAPPPVYVEADPDLLFTPSYTDAWDLRPLLSAPLLPGSATLPGYYGSTHSYYYQGPYYGGPGTVSYWDRLPYACGIYGYC